jgi:hypothetical protein
VARFARGLRDRYQQRQRNTYESFGPVVRDRLQRTFPILVSEFPIAPKGFPVLLKIIPSFAAQGISS